MNNHFTKNEKLVDDARFMSFTPLTNAVNNQPYL